MSKIVCDTIELKNFFSYGNSWTTIDLTEGVNLVLGRDKDKERSNGAGKTSFLEAIPFALFGQTGKGVPLPKIVNWRNGKQCEVRFHFRKDGIPYIIHRGIKPGKLELTRDGIVVPKLSDKRIFQQELETDLIGMDFKAAQAILFQNANNTISMFNTKKEDKRRFIERFFNLGVYSKAMEVANKKSSNIEKRLTEITSETAYTQRTIDDLFNKISSFVAPNLDEYKGNVVTIQVQYGTFIDNNPDIEGKLRVLHQESSDLVGRRDELNRDLLEEKEQLGNIRLEIRTVQTEAATKRQRMDAIGDLTDQQVKLGKVKDALAKMEGLEEQSIEKTNYIKELRVLLSEKRELMAGSKTVRCHAGDELQKWTNYSHDGESECPTCFQSVDPEHIQRHVDAQISKWNLELSICNDAIDVMERDVQTLETTMNDEGELLAEIDTKLHKKRQLEKALAKLSGVEEKQLELNELEQRITEIDTVIIPNYRDREDQLVEVVEQIQGEFDDIVQEMVDYDEEIEKCKEASRVLERLSNDLDNAEKILKNQKEIYDRLVGENEANIATKAQLEAEIVSTQSEVKKLETMKDYLEHIKFTLKDENVKQYAISSIVPFLQQQTNHYLAETGHNYYVELDNWLDGQIKGFGVGECDFGNMSGGEGKSIDLSLKFAMMDVARRQAGSYLDVMVLDELLDSSIDSHGLEKVVEIVNMKQREDALKVFIVSHREEVAGFGADRIYQVVKENGMSTIGLID